ncbi:anhydro-N-acetylmuramic acid kinase [Sphingomonas jatrophae]|uniref:Anhydro-N-acetylmuramic acid kinase n=1 Tax=Sphingomonas jatrophae TaxID=1166337 RepID=A0A1I6JMC6_9SPHN|nr:anhydro-N-acetylmuramic acid kinase [Sphingomonas jatrophae]SFR80087.1 anhydro-N-acetylmuramic acid kinase [Sphingomonas jatrophae]
MDSVLAVGLMSGTSLDGIDAALIETDGEGIARPIAFRSDAYSDAARAQLREACALALLKERPRPTPEIEAAAEMLTRRHALSVRQLLNDAGVAGSQVRVVGFHGQTVAHRPDRGWTWQIGDGQALADALGTPVVFDFRSADVAAGGQGAPLLPVYHAAIAARLERPLAILNLGGVGNLTFIGADGAPIAFDTGPANALIDDWMMAEAGRPFDMGGSFAGTGHVDEGVLRDMMDLPWFDLPPPKSLDRADFTAQPVRGLAPADGAATLTAFTAATVAQALTLLPVRPRRLIVAGGGRHNATLMRMLGERTGIVPEPIDALGLNGDATEAEGFAYMAVRHLAGLPISFPGTTGVPTPMTGGSLRTPAGGTAQRSGG